MLLLRAIYDFIRMLNFSVYSLWAERSGAVAATVAVFAAVLAVSAAVAVDMARAYQTRLVLQQSVDQAALAAAAVAFKADVGGPPDQSRMVEVVEAYLASEARLGSGEVEIGEPQVDLMASPQNEVTVSVTAQMATTFLRFADIYRINFAVSAKAKRPEPTDIELVLVLDGTEAMAQSLNGIEKGETVAASAMALARHVLARKGNKVGIVPYGSWINVGTTGEGLKSLQSQSWLELTDAAPNSCGPKADPLCSRAHSFNGCVGARRDLQDTIESPTNPRYPGLVGQAGDQCPAPRLTDLTGAPGSVLAGLGYMQSGSSATKHGSRAPGSFMPGGLVWGWNMLDPDIPLTRAASPGEGAAKVLVLVSGGPNTVRPEGSGFVAQSPAEDADRLTESLCTNIKKAGISIYTVAFGIEDSNTNSILKACASNPQQYFSADSNEALGEAMTRISINIGELRLAAATTN
jgi:hypothetical protein